jgi:3-mercaptopyruvate sulfurtransferase SseA
MKDVDFHGRQRAHGTRPVAGMLAANNINDDVRFYDGSWTEWGSSVGVPVEQ